MMSSLRHSLGPRQYLVIVVLVLLGESIHSKSCVPGLDSIGWTVPVGDITVEAGQTLEIFCILNNDYVSNKGHNAGNLRFYNGSDLINPEYVAVVNETTAKMTIKNASLTSSMFYCKVSNYLNNTSYLVNNIKVYPDENLNMETFVCMNLVKIGTKPGEVTNFTCISYNWDVLNVSWIPPYNPINTNYSIHYQTPKRPSRNMIFKCPNPEEMLTKHRCSWTTGSDPVYRSKIENLIFTIEGVNLFGNRTQIFKINNFAHILPDAPKNLQPIGKTESSITLEWNIGNLHILEKGLIFKVEYVWNSSSAIPWIPLIFNSKDLRVNTDKVTVIITDLEYPNTAYNFRVYLKSAVAISDAFWSAPASCIVRTKPAPPYFSPKTDVGSFENAVKSSFFRDIFVYWKPLSVINYNGDDFRYNFTVYSNGKYVPIEPNVVTLSYARYSNLSMGSYVFEITSVNAEGAANVSSKVYVPSKREMVREPSVFSKVIYQNGIYEVSWTSSSVSALTDFTVFWCESNRDRPFQCNGFINWIHLPSNVTKHNFTINSTSGYQFAVSANSANSSSGMTWVSCTTMHDQLSKIRNVYVSKVSTYSIDVDWKLECSEKLDSIRGYNITYCETDFESCNDTKYLLVYGDVNVVHGKIEGLKPFTYYRIQVAPFLKDGRLGPFSDELYNRTLEGPPDLQDVEIYLIDVTNSTVEINWTTPSVTHGVIRYYQVMYDEKSLLKTTDTWAHLDNLKSFTTYRVVMNACTIVCSKNKTIDIQTEIGIPGIVDRPLSPSINSSHAFVTWKKPAEPAGPKPIYDIWLQYHEDGKNYTEEQFQVNDTSAQVPVPKCRYDDSTGVYTIYVRAKNIFMEGDQKIEYIGEWSQAYSFDCRHASLSITWKLLVMVCITMLFIILQYYTKKMACKWYKRKNMEIVLPPNFTENVLLPKDSKIDKMMTYRIGEPYWSDKDECDRLNNTLEHQEKQFTDCANTTLISSKVNLMGPVANFNNSEETLMKSDDSLSSAEVDFKKPEVAEMKSNNPEVKLIIGLNEDRKSELMLENTKDGYLKL